MFDEKIKKLLKKSEPEVIKKEEKEDDDISARNHFFDKMNGIFDYKVLEQHQRPLSDNKLVLISNKKTKKWEVWANNEILKLESRQEFDTEEEAGRFFDLLKESSNVLITI